MAKLIAESGTIALVSLVSPFASDRKAAAQLHAEHELAFLEVFVSTPLERCEERDPKGPYARARAGEMAQFTGVGAPYQPPSAPDLVLDTAVQSLEEEVELVIEKLSARGLV